MKKRSFVNQNKVKEEKEKKEKQLHFFTFMASYFVALLTLYLYFKSTKFLPDK